jgi:AcrR family transcriptional regulator
MSKATGKSSASAEAYVDFRTRTGKARRARTRARILSAAFSLFDSQGLERLTVEDVRAEAGLARGSFYNYFETFEGMLKELAAEIARQLNAEQSERFDGISNLPERMWRNLSYAILRVASDRSCGEILVRVTPLVGSLTDHMREHAERDIRMAVKAKTINVPSLGVALDLGYGLATMMLRRALEAEVDVKALEAAGLMLLRAYGVPETEAKRIAHLRLPELPDVPLRTAVINKFDAA